MTSGEMSYNFSGMSDLKTTLESLEKDLLRQAGELETAAKDLMTAWEGTQGYQAFASLKNAWDQEFGSDTGGGNGTTIGTLRALHTAVENAAHNAKGADGAVEGLFSS